MRYLAAIGIVLFAVLAQAEIVTKTDGSTVEGKIEKTAGGWNVTQDDGKVVFIGADQVLSIAPGRTRTSAADAEDKLASLRRTTNQMSDIHQIIAKYHLFISQNNDAQTLQDAQNDLDQWNQRLDKGLVKLGDRWITAQERESRRQISQTEALGAADLMRQNRTKEADVLLKQAVTDDPQNPTALFLQGVSFYSENQLDKAQSAFEAANAASPGHGPTLNNLGVIASRHHAYLPSVNFSLQAMNAAPQTRDILDNMAEALNAVPQTSRKAMVVTQAAAIFQAQDLALQQTEARNGQYRWGSSWVTSVQLDQLKAEEAAGQKQLDKLKSINDNLQDQINDLNGQMDATNQQMHRMAAAVTSVDVYGNSVQMQLPPQYYELQDDANKMLAQRKILEAKQADVNANAKQIQAQMPSPPFSGVEHIMGIDAVAPVEAPATQP